MLHCGGSLIPKEENTKKQRKCAPQERTLTGEGDGLLKAAREGENKRFKRGRGGREEGEQVGERLSQT